MIERDLSRFRFVGHSCRPGWTGRTIAAALTADAGKGRDVPSYDALKRQTGALYESSTIDFENSREQLRRLGQFLQKDDRIIFDDEFDRRIGGLGDRVQRVD